ncbi:BTAD domain-containing putative transcriptional regulator [Rhizohabitans arisaemae]|uniref:BTAD domain-containing putative transcriptional regulator n=1 Tax=Rhizohabitans arisaemae TaxID=2720610 RepID=UPI0024B254EB|nr:BTAD domain-containing putative transcriptional regulator [Rhizohabitans arisaemae]
MPTRIEQRRSPADVLVGLGATAAIAALVFGVPYALLRFFGSPISPELFDTDLLTGQVGLSTVVAVLVIFVWLAWLQLVVCVIVEIYAGIRRVGMPVAVPLSGGSQALARRLVSAALILFSVSTVSVPVLAQPVAQPAVTATVARVAEPEPLRVTQTKKVYVVQPPHGRHHESLWEIAEKCLGDGRRYGEIYRLNKHKEQPDGSRLRIADLIRPGWVLNMPDDAVNVHIVPAKQSRPAVLADHPGKPAEADGKTQVTRGPITADSTVIIQVPRAEVRAPAAVPAPAPAPEVVPEAPVEQVVPEQVPEAAAEESSAPDLLGYLAASSLAAAGLLLVLGRRRREQLWRRVFGRRVPRPVGDAARAEQALRIGADAPGSRMLDIGLRHLAASLAAGGRTPPTVYGVHLSAATLDLWVHPPDSAAPAPWEAYDEGRVWRLPAPEGRRLDDHRDTPAPYPGLVSIGSDGSGRVLIDLEAAHGLISLRAPGHLARSVLASLAVELATNLWSDQMQITLVGVGEELTLIAPDRIRAVRTLAEALPELERQAEEVRRALDETGAPDVLTGRVRGAHCAPHYLLSAVAPDAGELERLLTLSRAGTRTAAGFVVAGDIPEATWVVEVDGDRRTRVDALGFEVEAQLLPPREYGAVVELFRTASRQEGDRLAVPTGPITSLETDPSVEVRVLGSLEVVAPGRSEDARLPLLTEIVVYLATHPGGVHPGVLGGVIWPRGVQASVRDACIARVRDWLGRDEDGSPNLVIDQAGRIGLGPQVRTDWQVFRELVRRAGRNPRSEAALLEQALSLVRGPLLTGRPQGRYAWLAMDELEFDVVALVADAAHRLHEIRLAQGDPDAAVAAVRAGLLLAADDENLWRDLLRATHETGDAARLRAVADALSRRSASHPYGGGMAPETEALIDDLLPSWRLQAVADP